MRDAGARDPGTTRGSPSTLRDAGGRTPGIESFSVKGGWWGRQEPGGLETGFPVAEGGAGAAGLEGEEERGRGMEEAVYQAAAASTARLAAGLPAIQVSRSPETGKPLLVPDKTLSASPALPLSPNGALCMRGLLWIKERCGHEHAVSRCWRVSLPACGWRCPAPLVCTLLLVVHVAVCCALCCMLCALLLVVHVAVCCAHCCQLRTFLFVVHVDVSQAHCC